MSAIKRVKLLKREKEMIRKMVMQSLLERVREINELFLDNQNKHGAAGCRAAVCKVTMLKMDDEREREREREIERGIERRIERGIESERVCV